MGAIDEAIAVLLATEQKLRALIVQAAERADYDHLPLLAEWTKQLSAILGASGTAGTSPGGARELPPLAVQASNGADRRPPAPKACAARAATRTGQGAGRGRKGRKTRRTKPDYPRFFRDVETLVKVGWSRREKKTYEHKAPRSVLQALVQALKWAGAGGRVFTTEDLFPLKDPTDSSEIPDYQAYLTLAWLRGSDLIVQHGRQGYSLPEGMDLSHEIERLWNNLPAR